MPKVRFDWTFNMGHLLTLAGYIGGGLIAFIAIQTRLDEVDRRTADYPIVRDLVKETVTQVAILNKTVTTTDAALTKLSEQQSGIRADLAGLTASVKAIADTLQRQSFPR